MRYPSAVEIREVGPRDGLQNEATVPTSAKVALIDALGKTGLSAIEAASFVRPDAIPQMADADEVWRAIDKVRGVKYSALVLNARGAVRAVNAGVRILQFALSASEEHNKRNAGRSIGQSIAELGHAAEVAADAGAVMDVTISTAWGCPYSGDVPFERVIEVAERSVVAGGQGVSLGDTTGMATPRRVTTTVAMFRKHFGADVRLNLHFHNTRGAGLANVLAAMDSGCTFFDSSIGGLGGCPYAPGATGNICTEDLVHMLDDCGVSTGVDLESLIRVARMAERTASRELPGQILRAGPRLQLASSDDAPGEVSDG